MEAGNVIPEGSTAKLRKLCKAFKRQEAYSCAQLANAMKPALDIDRFLHDQTRPPVERSLDDLLKLPVLIATADQEPKQRLVCRFMADPFDLWFCQVR